MNIRFVRMFAIILAMFFLSSCAVWVRDEDGHHYHHRGYWHHSSLQQPDQSVSQMTAHGVYHT
jgi:hypothetical protein